MMLQAGFCSVDITPTTLYPMGGYDLRKECAQGTHDPLFARAVVMKNDSLVCGLCSLDLLGVSVDMVEEIRERVKRLLLIPDMVFQIGATHTHAAPEAMFRDAPCFDKNYRSLVINGAVTAITNAYTNCYQVTPQYAHTAVDGVASRRDVVRERSVYAMPCDTLWLKAVDRNRRDILVSVFACHPTVLNEANRQMTGDLVWACDHRIKQQAPNVDTLFINGACADLSTRYTRLASSYEETVRLGAIWADGVLDSLSGTKPLCESLDYKEYSLFIPPADFFTAEQLPLVLQHLEEKINRCADDQEQREYVSCRSVLSRSDYGTETGCNATLGVLRLGSILLCSLPFEYASADADPLKAQIAAASGYIPLFCGYSNGYEGYLPSGRPLDCDSGYEDIASPFCHNAKELVAQAFLSLADTLAKS